MLDVRTSPCEGMSTPTATSRFFSPIATAKPAKTPRIDAIMPTARASTSTEAKIWRRLAPSARSSPFSLVRCATVMEKVLNIMNPPTSTATTAKISRNV